MAPEQSELRSKTNQAVLTFATKIGMMALRLTRNIILARVLGVADRGAFAFIMSLPDLILVLASAGLQTSAARLGAEEKEPGRAITMVALVGLVVGVLLTSVVFGVFELPILFRGYYERVEFFAPVVAFVTIVLSVRFLLTQYMVGAGWVGGMNAARMMESVFLFVVMLGFFAFGYMSLKDVVVSWGLAYLLLGGVMVGMIFHYRRPGPAVSRQKLVELFHFGARGHADMIFQRILMRADFVFISMMLGAEELGYYAIAAVGAEVLTAVPEAANAPLTKRLLSSGEHNQFDVTMIATRWVVLLTAVCGLIGGLLADFGVRLLFGEEFAPAVPALLVLIPAVVLSSGVSFVRLALIGRERPGVVSVVLGAVAVLNLVLNWFMIPVYGIVGAASASFLCYVLGFVGLYFALVRDFKESWTALFRVTPAEWAMMRKALEKGGLLRASKPENS